MRGFYKERLIKILNNLENNIVSEDILKIIFNYYSDTFINEKLTNKGEKLFFE